MNAQHDRLRKAAEALGQEVGDVLSSHPTAGTYPDGPCLEKHSRIDLQSALAELDAALAAPKEAGASACPLCGEDTPHPHMPSDVTRWLATQAQRFRSVMGTSLGNVKRYDLYEDRESGYYSSRMIERPAGKYVTYADHLEHRLAAPSKVASPTGVDEAMVERACAAIDAFNRRDCADKTPNDSWVSRPIVRAGLLAAIKGGRHA